MSLKLPDGISSSQDINSVIIEIRNYSQWFSHNVIKLRVGGKKTSDSPPPISAETRELLSDYEAKHSLNSSSMDELIKNLEAIKNNASSLTITLAAPATKDIRLALVAWCRKNVAKDILVNFSFNATILGGMVIRRGSHIFDWSFKRQIMANRNKFPEILRRV
jgi:hypothetical protein